jgi:dipeptidase D
LKKGKSQPYLDGNNSNNLIKIMNVLPHGMIRMSPVIPNLVETSVNLASIRTEKEKIIITMMARSNIDDELSIFRQSIQDLAILAGWSIKMKDAYPGWAPDLTQPLLKYVKEQYAAVISENIRVEAIHAGLECGIIGKKIPGMQMIAMGPTVRGLHSPEERVEVASVEKAYTVLHSVIKNLKNIEKMH